jgi:hypothetical protein
MDGASPAALASRVFVGIVRTQISYINLCQMHEPLLSMPHLSNVLQNEELHLSSLQLLIETE